MSEFDKLKIGFVLALLGTVFAVHPIAQEYRSLGYTIIRIDFTVWRLYVAMSATLSLAVYFYALNMARERPLSVVQTAGHVAYALSLLLVPAYLVVWAAIPVGTAIGSVLRLPGVGGVASGILGALIVAASAFYTQRLSKRFREREARSVASQFTAEEADHAARAGQMLTARHYDLAVIESGRAIEAALRRGLVERGIEPTRAGLRQLVQQALDKDVVPKEALSHLEKIRVARNHAVHSAEPIDAARAEAIVELTTTVLAMVRYPLMDADNEQG